MELVCAEVAARTLRTADAALIGGDGITTRGGVEGQTATADRHRLGRPAVVCQSPQPRVTDRKCPGAIHILFHQGVCENRGRSCRFVAIHSDRRIRNDAAVDRGRATADLNRAA